MVKLKKPCPWIGEKNLQISQGRKIIFRTAVVRLVADFEISTLKGRRYRGNISYCLAEGKGEVGDLLR